MAASEAGLVLAVRPWGSARAWALPGGGVERGESYAEAAVRECYEETGFVPTALEPLVRTRQSGRWVTCYWGEGLVGVLRSSEEGEARWVEPADLLRGRYPGAFAAALDALAERFSGC